MIDPNEKQFFVSTVKNSNYDKNSTTNLFNYDYLFPFGLSIFRNIYANKNYQFSVEGGTHTVFGIRRENNAYLNGHRRSYLNTDFIIELDYSIKFNEHFFLKTGIMHRSTHLGDDFILLQGITAKDYWRNDPSNYEVAKATVLYKSKFIKSYARLGYVIRKDTPRKKLEIQTGFFISEASQKKIIKNLVFGIDMKMLENNGYNPGFKTAFGYRFIKDACFMIEYYNGNFPYSRYETDLKIRWFGIGLYIDSFN